MTTPLPVWRRAFSRKDPLTQRFARTVAETETNPMAWFEGPEAGPRLTWREALRWIGAFALLFFAFYVLPRIW